jgi:hypothetical protein
MPATGTGPIFLDNQYPLFATNSLSSPTRLYIYAKTVPSDSILLKALEKLATDCAAGGFLTAVSSALNTWVVAVSTTSTDLLKGYSRLEMTLA